MPAKKKASPINTEVTVMIVFSNGFGLSKSTITPVGGGTLGVLLSWIGSNCATWPAIRRQTGGSGEITRAKIIKVSQMFRKGRGESPVYKWKLSRKMRVVAGSYTRKAH